MSLLYVSSSLEFHNMSGDLSIYQNKVGQCLGIALFFCVFWIEFDFKVEVVDKRIVFFYNYVIFLRIFKSHVFML